MALQRSKSSLKAAKPGLQRAKPGLGRLDKTGKFRTPLAFIEPAPDPTAGIDVDVGPADILTVGQQALKDGFIARMKAEKIRHDETTRTDYYFTVVFEHGSQANAFLTKCGYRDPTSQFVDGTLLAATMNVELPPSPFKLKKLRPSDRTLQHLVSPLMRREVNKAPG